MRILYALFHKDTTRPFGVFVSSEEAEFEKTLVGRPSEIIEIPTYDLLLLKIEKAYEQQVISSSNS